MEQTKPTRRTKARPASASADRTDGTATVRAESKPPAAPWFWSQVVERAQLLERDNPQRRIVAVFCEHDAPEFYQGARGNARVIKGAAGLRWSDGTTEQF